MQYKRFKLVSDGKEWTSADGYSLDYRLVAEWSQSYPGAEILSEDIRTPYEVLVTDCEKSRLDEYPSVHEIVVALTDKERGDATALTVILAKQIAVKEKYPLPDPAEAEQSILSKVASLLGF